MDDDRHSGTICVFSTPADEIETRNKQSRKGMSKVLQK